MIAHAPSDRRRLIHSHDWFPVGIVRPLPDRPLEFQIRVEEEAAHRGAFSGGAFVVGESRARVDPKDVLAWRYLPHDVPADVADASSPPI